MCLSASTLSLGRLFHCCTSQAISPSETLGGPVCGTSKRLNAFSVRLLRYTISRLDQTLSMGFLGQRIYHTMRQNARLKRNLELGVIREKRSHGKLFADLTSALYTVQNRDLKMFRLRRLYTTEFSNGGGYINYMSIPS
jgi:hypothetical protein